MAENIAKYKTVMAKNVNSGLKATVKNLNPLTANAKVAFEYCFHFGEVKNDFIIFPLLVRPAPAVDFIRAKNPFPCISLGC